MLFGASALLCLLRQRLGQFCRRYAKRRLCFPHERSRVRSLSTSARSSAALRILLTRRFGARRKSRGRIPFENQKEEFMKHLLLILSILALVGTATAQTPPKDGSDKGKECSKADCCCCKK